MTELEVDGRRGGLDKQRVNTKTTPVSKLFAPVLVLVAGRTRAPTPSTSGRGRRARHGARAPKTVHRQKEDEKRGNLGKKGSNSKEQQRKEHDCEEALKL